MPTATKPTKDFKEEEMKMGPDFLCEICQVWHKRNQAPTTLCGVSRTRQLFIRTFVLIFLTILRDVKSLWSKRK